MRQDADRRRKCWTFGLLTLSLASWLPPSDVLRLIARQREVFLGRYSLERLEVLLLVTLFSWLAAYGVWTSGRTSRRPRAFRLLSVTSSILISVVGCDLVLRTTREARYTERIVQLARDESDRPIGAVARYRQADKVFHVRTEDVPPTARSYPTRRPGYPAFDVTFSIDSRGFRNRTQLARYDIVTLGDSFTEGHSISDGQEWPALLSLELDRSVYNLGVGGTNPGHYLAAFSQHGTVLEPKVAIFMIYEGNDFKSLHSPTNALVAQPPLLQRIRHAVKFSPVRLALVRALVRHLAPIRATAPLPGAEILSWMPAAIPAGAHANYYAFSARHLTRLYWTAEEFRSSANWVAAAEMFRRIQEISRRDGIRAVFAFAPSKPHVVMPLLRERVSPEQLRTFAAFKKRGLPPAHEFAERFYRGIDSQEQVLRAFCEREGIPFVSTTEILRSKVLAGEQIYYTYDQHWTPLGHKAVAEALSAYLSSPQM
jgi:hypothetical protein